MSPRARTNDHAEPARPRGMRRANLGLVLGDVMAHGPRSRATIAEATGLTKTTVSSLVSDLTRWGLLAEVGREEARAAGRPGRLVALSGESVAGLGLEINVDYLATTVLDLTGHVRHERIERRDNRVMPAARVLDALDRMAHDALDTAADAGLSVVGATVAAPGLVDVDAGMLVDAPNLGWRGVPLADELAARMGETRLAVRADNEANLAALGELWHGGGAALGDFIHVSGEIGIGAGIVVRGELLRGGAGFSGEFGHIPIGSDPVPCPCGSYGCLERVVGQEALLHAAGLDAEIGTRIGVPDGGIAALVQRADDGDDATLVALHRAGVTLGRAVATMVNLFAPDSVVLGGIFVPLFEWIIGPLREELHARAFVMRHADVRVVPSALGAAAAMRGAASLALRTVCADPLLLAPTED